MDVQEQKDDLIQWLTNLEDPNIIDTLNSIRISNLEKKIVKPTSEERKAIDEGLHSIETSGTKPHSEVIETTKNKYPHLFE